MESIAEITSAMLYDSCKAFYAPGNMGLAAAGNTTREQSLALNRAYNVERQTGSTSKPIGAYALGIEYGLSLIHI